MKRGIKFLIVATQEEEHGKKLGVHIDGYIYAFDENEDIDLEDFLDKFIEFLEANGWSFGGGTHQIDWDGEGVKTDNEQ